MSDSAKRRGLVIATLSAPLLTGCIWPRLFDLAWDEEVQLHDGTILVLATKVQFQRNSTFSRYGNTVIVRRAP